MKYSTAKPIKWKNKNDLSIINFHTTYINDCKCVHCTTIVNNPLSVVSKPSSGTYSYKYPHLYVMGIYISNSKF